MMQGSRQKNLLGIAGMTAAEIDALLTRAQEFAAMLEKNPHLRMDTLKDRFVLNLFLENSTRTRVSFEMAAQRLGATVINVAAEGSSVKKGESLHDTLATLAAMRPDFLVIRCKDEGSAELAAKKFSGPVLNAGDGTNEHPTQALLDALALRQHFGRLEGLTIAICGDIRHSRVARSNAILLPKFGAKVRLVGPRRFLPEMAWPGAEIFHDMAAGLAGCDAVMMLRIQKERMDDLPFPNLEDYFQRYGLTQDRLAQAAAHAVVLHPGPLNRGVEIAPDVADDAKKSLILQQVTLGVPVRMACLEMLAAAHG